MIRRSAWRPWKVGTLAAVSGIAVLGAGTAGLAATITYAPPSIVGTTVVYTDVSESSGSDPVPLYGIPSISGDTLIFRNMSFSATSVNATPAVDFTDGQLNATLESRPGSFLTSFGLSEFGDYNISATPANPAAINFVKVFPQAIQISVLEIDGVPLASPLMNNFSAVMSFSPSNGDFLTGVDPSVGNWTGQAFADLTALFGSDHITRISISFDNQLLAQSQVGGIASISKKGFDLNPGTTVPEPASMAGLGGAALLAGLRRRRARHSMPITFSRTPHAGGANV